MHFIHKILCFKEFLHKIALLFKNPIFPDFWSIEYVARLIEIAIKILVTICLARLMLDWSNLIFNWLKLIFNRSKIGLSVLKRSFSRVLHTFHTFSNTPLSIFLDWSNLKQFFFFFFHFLPQIFQGFLSSSLSKSLLPFLFH